MVNGVFSDGLPNAECRPARPAFERTHVGPNSPGREMGAGIAADPHSGSGGGLVSLRRSLWASARSGRSGLGPAAVPLLPGFRLDASAPPDGLGKVGSASALRRSASRFFPLPSRRRRPLPLLSDCPLAASAMSWSLPIRYRSAAPGHTRKVSRRPSRDKRNPPVDKMYNVDKLDRSFGHGGHTFLHGRCSGPACSVS